MLPVSSLSHSRAFSRVSQHWKRRSAALPAARVRGSSPCLRRGNLSNVPPSGRAAACWPSRGRSGCRHCRAQERARTEVFGCRGNARERDCWVAWSVFGPVGDSHASSRAAVPFAPPPPQLMPLPVAPGAGGVGRAAASAVRGLLPCVSPVPWPGAAHVLICRPRAFCSDVSAKVLGPCLSPGVSHG